MVSFPSVVFSIVIDRFNNERLRGKEQALCPAYLSLKNRELQILKVVECFSGVFGFRPVMEAYIPDEMRRVYLNRIVQKNDRDLRDFIHHWEREGGKEAASRTMYPGMWDMNNTDQMWHRIKKDHPEWVQEWTLDDVPCVLYTSSNIQDWRNRAIDVGFYQSELEQFIQWRVRPLNSKEREALTEMVKIVANTHADNAAYKKELHRINQKYTAIMAHDLIVEKFGEDHGKLPEDTVMPYLQKVTERIVWQMTELQEFIFYCFRYCPRALQEEPIKVPSGKYEEKLKPERTQADLITEMSQELANLPRFTAYAKVIAENEGEQTVWRGKIKTSPLPPWQEAAFQIESHAIKSGHKFCKTRDLIEEEIRQRQERWRSNTTDEAPPTHS